MAPATLAEALSQFTSQPDPCVAFKAILSNIKTLSTPDKITEDLESIADTMLGSSLGVVQVRQMMTDFIATLKELNNHDLWIGMGMHLVNRINESTSLSSSLIEAVAATRELVASGHEGQDDFAAAARVLAEIPLDSSARRISDAERASIWIRIVRDYLEVDDGTAAEMYLNKLKNVMPDVADPTLQLHFKLSAARIQDANRQFLAAARSYHQISFSPDIAEEERLHTLSMAIKCAVLAPAGPLRSRVLASLYKDERSAGLEEHGILEKMFLDRLLAPAEVEKFAQGLAPHQLATTADGSTVLARAVVEHNLLGASRLFDNIGFDELGLLLGLNGDKGEETTAKMIEQGRVSGWIDQIDRIIYFSGGEASGEKGSGRAEVSNAKEMRRWDANVQGLAEHVEHLTNALQAEFPEFAATQIPV
jgi:COP9 signalosome complex subunit 4